MNGKRTLCIAIGLATAPAALPAWAQAQQAPPPEDSHSPASGLTELTDEEMGDMRGRYTVDTDTVAWFGVTMVSTWQNEVGQQLTSQMKISMDVSQPDQPKVTFQPHVSITQVDAPSLVPSGQREIDNAGLANVNGMVQSIQVAGDGNAASNTAKVSLRESDELPAASPQAPVAAASTTTALATASAPGMSAVASLENNAARVLLQIDGQGAVEQWISGSGMGQTIQLAADGQQASNWLELDLVRHTSQAQARSALGQNVAQAIALSRGIAIGY
jgi:hypothetical protein